MPPVRQAPSRPAVMRLLGYAASATLVGWLLFGVLPAIGDLDGAGQLLVDNLRIPDVLLMFALLTAYLLTHALTLTTAAPSIALPGALLVRAVTGAIGRFIPAGWAAGTGVMVRMLRRRGVRGEAITHALAVTSVWNTLTRLALPLLGLAAVAIVGAVPVPEGGAVAGLGIVSLVTVLVAIHLLGREAVARRAARVLERPMSTVARRLDRRAPVDLPERAVRLQASTAEALRERPLGMALWYCAHHVTQIALIWTGMQVAARGAGLEVGWPGLLLAFSIGYLLTGLPISPGGLGTMDVAVVTVLAALGEEPAVVSAGLMVYRVTTYGLYTAALAAWPLWRPPSPLERE